MDNHVIQHFEIPQIQYTDKVTDDSIVIQRQISPKTTETKTPEHQWDDRSDCDSRIENFNVDKRSESITHYFKERDRYGRLHEQQYHMSCQSNDTEWFLQASPTEKEETIDDQTRSIDSHEIQCEKEYAIDLRVDTGTLFFPERNLISTNDHGEQIDHTHSNKDQSKHTDKGKDNHVDVLETNQHSDTDSTMSAIESDDTDESVNMMNPGTETWRLIHSRYAWNTTEMISGSLLNDHTDKYNRLRDQSSDESKEQKHTDNQRHELQPNGIRSLDEYLTKFRDEHNEITKTMRDLSIVQHQTEMKEKADNEQQLRRELSMIAQDNDAKNDDVNSRQDDLRRER